MLWFILAVAVGVLLGLIKRSPMAGTLLALCGGMLFLVSCSEEDLTYTITTTEVRLVSLRSADQVSGSFFLGCGSIGTSQHYFFYKDVGNGGYKQDKIKVDDNVTIFEEDRQDGILISRSYQQLNRPRCWPEKCSYESPRPLNFEFHIPRGSLQKKFQLE